MADPAGETQPPSRPPASRDVALSAQQAFAAVDVLLARGRPADAEALLRALARDPAQSLRSEARFRLGRLRERAGDYRAAVQWYRAILDEEPRATVVRLALARAYLHLGATVAAAGEFRRVQAARLPVAVARQVDRISAALRDTAPYGLDVSIGIAPDTNTNRANTASTLDAQGIVLAVSRDGRARPGVGLEVSSRGFARVPLSGSSELLVEMNGAASLYPSGRSDDAFVTLSAGPEFDRARLRIHPSAIVGRRAFDGHRLYDQIGLGIDLRRALDRTTQLTASATVSDLRYPGRAFLSGLTYNATVTVEKALSPRLYAITGVSFSRAGARDAAYATTALGPLVVVSRDVGRATVFASGSVSRLDADAAFALFGRVRRDWYAAAQLGVTARIVTIAGLSPSARIEVSRNASTVPLYAFHRARIELALSRQY